MITYLVWDAGGTLFDTYPAVVSAASTALQGLGLVPPPSNLLLEWFRETVSAGVRRVVEMYSLDGAQFAALFEASYERIDAACQPPFPGVIEVCREMCHRNGRNFIITHRDRASLQKLLDAHGMAGYFTALVTAEDPFPRKPDPTSILALLQRYALKPEEGLAIGDRDLDIQAGKNASLRTCFFGEEPHTTRADLEIVHYNVLYEWLWQEEPGSKR
ncbi:MAG: HAD-IA family hydrolase [Anaerolineae bacterium]|nr:HAD-IA family hydrolase [Anaerolineae bacterium]